MRRRKKDEQDQDQEKKQEQEANTDETNATEELPNGRAELLERWRRRKEPEAQGGRSQSFKPEAARDSKSHKAFSAIKSIKRDFH